MFYLLRKSDSNGLKEWGLFAGMRIEALCVSFQISLVDLAGSERAAKTGATAEQLKVTSFASYPLAYFTVNEINPPPISFLHHSAPFMLFSGLLQPLILFFYVV